MIPRQQVHVIGTNCQRFDFVADSLCFAKNRLPNEFYFSPVESYGR